MSLSDLPQGQAFDVHAAVRRQSWTWMDAIVRRLNLTLEVLDVRGRVCPPLVTATNTTTLRRALAATSGDLMADLARVVTTHQRQWTSVDGIGVLAIPLTLDQGVVGILIVARDAHPSTPPAEARSDAEIEAAGTWLARTIEAQLDVPGPDDDDVPGFDRVSSLHRVLNEVVDRGVERDVLTSFAEALIAWDDIEVRAYAEDMQGQFLLAVATPGIDRAEAARMPVAGLESRGSGLARVPFQEAARLGFPYDRDVFVARLGSDHSQPWLLLLSGALAAHDESRLALYVDILREAVVRAAMVAETRITWAVLQQLMTLSDTPVQAAEGALAELARAVDALGSALVVTDSSGVNTLSLGDSATFSGARSSSQFDELATTLHVLETHTMVLAVRRAPGHPFTRREQTLVDRAAATFAAWLPAMLRRLPQGSDRRTDGRAFDRSLDRMAAQHLDDGLDVVVLVLLAPGAVSKPGLIHRWVSEIRSQLRASDLAGALSDREIGILLSGTTDADLAVVRERILRKVTTAEAGVPVTLGMAARRAGEPREGSIVAAARQDAAGRTSGGSLRGE